LGAWISFDGIDENNVEEYVRLIKNMKENNLLNKVLISHDAGWYDPGKVNGGEYRGYAAIFEKLIPSLREEHFSEIEIRQLMVINPARAFEIRIRKFGPS
jgi:phosphotriesterase-related protein